MNLYGASGHAKVIIDILKNSKNNISAIFDDNKNIKEVVGVEVKSAENINTSNTFIISIGNNKIRKEISLKLGTEFGKAIHPKAIIDSTTKISEGTVVMAGAIINSSTNIGKHCIVNTASSIDHDCVLEDFVHISPNATLCGNVTVGEGTHVGAGATIIPGIKIGKWVTIGAGSVVIKDVEDGVTVVGNPGRILINKTSKIISNE
jgi:acetyltransferase EpsM